MPGITWNTELDLKFFLFILATNPSMKIEYEAVARKFEQEGYTCSVDALRSRMKRIKKQIFPGEGSSEATSSPTKPKPPSKTSKRAAIDESSQQDDDEPSVKRRKQSAKPVVKPEKPLKKPEKKDHSLPKIKEEEKHDFSRDDSEMEEITV